MLSDVEKGNNLMLTWLTPVATLTGNSTLKPQRKAILHSAWHCLGTLLWLSFTVASEYC